MNAFFKSQISTSFFNELLEKDNSISMHDRNLAVLATILNKVVTGLFPKLFSDCFHSRSVCTVLHGTKSLF